ncbi:hypothetical protein EJ110_NYTH17476 [Nymphaea thermarum]|nr:hypothetical protein EJ110_NYTH17476 [Nymphaea thermarum]
MQPFKLVEKYLISCIYLIPDLVTKVTHDRACRLLQAFTSTFKGCRSKSELKLACLSSMKQILGNGQDMLFADLGREILKIWVQALPRLLVDLGQEHPVSSEPAAWLNSFPYCPLLRWFFVFIFIFYNVNVWILAIIWLVSLETTYSLFIVVVKQKVVIICHTLCHY